MSRSPAIDAQGRYRYLATPSSGSTTSTTSTRNDDDGSSGGGGSLLPQRRATLVSGIIIEPRPLRRQIERSIQNVVAELPSVRPIHLFHGLHFEPCEEDSPESSSSSPFSLPLSSPSPLCRLIALEVVVPHRLTVDNLTHRAYNRFMMQPALWSLLGGEDQVLVFQTDVSWLVTSWKAANERMNE